MSPWSVTVPRTTSGNEVRTGPPLFTTEVLTTAEVPRLP